MNGYPYQLESGSRKFTCPSCGKPKRFRRVIELATGQYLPDHVGRCDRISSCGYEYTWKQYLIENPAEASHASAHQPSRSGQVARPSPGVPDYIPQEHLRTTIGGYSHNSLVKFLLELFPRDHDGVGRAIRRYLVGTLDGYTVFPVISRTGRICKAKLMKFDATTGKRIRDAYSTSSLQFRLKRAGLICEDFTTDKDVFFGEHLIQKNPHAPIAVVESEKTALIASICERVFPDVVWLATGSKQSLKPERIKRLGRGRKYMLYPDADGYEKWLPISSRLQREGYSVHISGLIERQASTEEKSQQFDLADYLIREQTRRNDPLNQATYSDIIEERLAVMMVDGVVSESSAEDFLLTSGFAEYAERLAVADSQI